MHFLDNSLDINWQHYIKKEPTGTDVADTFFMHLALLKPNSLHEAIKTICKCTKLI